MKNTTEQFFIIVPPGFESACAKELSQLTDAPLTLSHGGITFKGKLRDLYLTNLWLRSASRILVRLDNFNCRDFPSLYRKSLRLPWGRFIQPGRPLSLRVTCRGSRLIHSDRVAETIEDAIHKALGTTAAEHNNNQEQQTIFVRIDNDQCTISMDSSGELLHKRGYRVKSTAAPLRETIAAGCLLHCNWSGETPLWDPFCGSGTFPIEAALIAANIPPGRQRRFSFMNWPGFRQGLWNTLIAEANKLKREVKVAICASDLSEEALTFAHLNARQAGVESMIHFHQQDAFTPYPQFIEGLIICNPPYGERLASDLSPQKLLKKLTGQFKSHDKISTAILLPQDKQMPHDPLITLSNGGLDVALYSTIKSRTQ